MDFLSGFTRGEYLVIRGDSKETAFCLCRLYWLHQWGIPYRTCRFHCCLAAHQRTRKKDSAEPSFPILWTPPHPPGGIRCGGAYLLPRVWGNLGIRYPVQTVCPHFNMTFGCFVFGLGLFAFQKITLGLCRSFFIIGRMNCSFLRLRGVLPFSFVGLPLTAPFHQFCLYKPISPIAPGKGIS